MTTLNYDEDNYFGTYNRGTRYDIYNGDELVYHDVSEYQVDYLAAEMDKKPWIYDNIIVKEIKR